MLIHTYAYAYPTEKPPSPPAPAPSPNSWTQASRNGGASVAVDSDDLRAPISSSVVAVVLQLHGRRGLSSRSGGEGQGDRGRWRPAEKPQEPTAEAKDDTEKQKESYTFLEEKGRLLSESKVRQRERVCRVSAPVEEV